MSNEITDIATELQKYDEAFDFYMDRGQLPDSIPQGDLLGGVISQTVQDYCEKQGYGIVRELTGHGIGKVMHEDPQVPNYGRRGNGPKLKEGMCIAIEPMVTQGDRKIWLLPDKWSIVTRDKKFAAHYEHTIAIRKGKSEILSSFEEIETIFQI